MRDNAFAQKGTFRRQKFPRNVSTIYQIGFVVHQKHLALPFLEHVQQTRRLELPGYVSTTRQHAYAHIRLSRRRKGPTNALCLGGIHVRGATQPRTAAALGVTFEWVDAGVRVERQLP